MSAGHTGPSAHPLALMAGGVTMLGCGPWLVRLAGAAPVATAFWRLALAVPLLVLLCAALRIRKRTLSTA